MKVNVCIITYNHESYISEAIISVLKQVTNFQIKIIIGEDCSTDNTRQICENLANQHPEKIILLPLTENLGMLKNFTRCYSACNSDYIAFIEGDDYWTDPSKLQKQADFLMQNPSYTGCFHNAVIREQRNGNVIEWLMHKNGLAKDSFETADILKPWFIPSGSVMFVKHPDFILPDWFFNCRSGDIPMLLLLSLKGPFKYLDEPMSVYRLHAAGMSSSHTGYRKITLMIYIYESFNIYTNYIFQREIDEAIAYEIDEHLPKVIPFKQPVENAPTAKSFSGKLKKRIADFMNGGN